EKFSQKKKLLVDNEYRIMDYSLKEIQLSKITKDKNIKQAMIEETNGNLSNTIVELTITNREIEMITSQEKRVIRVEKKNEKPIKKKSMS
ncbi:5252_t:CDS:1, partial [Gigaspora margarita]